MQTLQGLVPFDSAWWGEFSAGDVQVAPRNWLHGSMGLSRSFAEEWNALAAVDLFGLQSMQQLGVVIRERDAVGPEPDHPDVVAFSQRHGLHHCMALTAELPHSGLMFFVSIYRPPTRPEFSDGETVLFGEFVLHLLQQWHHRLQRCKFAFCGDGWITNHPGHLLVKRHILIRLRPAHLWHFGLYAAHAHRHPHAVLRRLPPARGPGQARLSLLCFLVSLHPGENHAAPLP